MSINRCRNIFTLGDFPITPSTPYNTKENLKRRQNADPFEKDPFKTHSYNFRYAERPKFPMPTLPEANRNRSADNDCRTFFYNEDFSHRSDIQRSNCQNDVNRSMNLTKFQEYRRRKYLKDASLGRNLTSCSNSPNNTVNKPYNSKPQKLYCDSHQNTQHYKPSFDSSYARFATYPYGAKNNVETKTYQNSLAHNLSFPRDISQDPAINGTSRETNQQPGSLAAFVNGNPTRSTVRPTQQRSHQSLATSSRGVCINRRRSSSSGCEININISNGENDSRSDNVIIKIETESKNRSTSPFNKPKLDRLASSPSFCIDKRLSKFSLNKEREQQQVNSSGMRTDKKNKTKADQVKLLTAVYSPQLLQTKPKPPLQRLAPYRERLPSMIPFRSVSDLVAGSYHDRKPKKSNLQAISENINYSLTNSKDHTKSSYNYHGPSCSYNVSNNENKLLNSTILRERDSFLKMFDSSTHALQARLNKNPKVISLHSLPVVETRRELKPIGPQLHGSHSKLPINVNINVYTDKYKFLKT